ncbi:hypothetical protein EZS27_005866 [termite gut metagenome]|uniref:Type II toxin-antitoxin system RelE/ParE family toxin n=1 Tax=termite gut metagenome TaxID=433724 RepID=A0A5J4SMH7_9ZZZZ
MKVIYSEEVIEFLSDLMEILYIKNYFGFMDSAINYVKDLVHEIDTTIASKQKKTAPDYFSKYGRGLFYVCYKKSRNTQWYVFFHYENDVYYIRYIGNNHNISQYL